MLQRKARLIIQEIEAGGGIDMEYVRQAAKEDGLTEKQMIAYWLRDQFPVSGFQANGIADYFLEKDSEQKENKKMKKYRIMEQYLDMWGEDVPADYIVTQEEVEHLAKEWEVPVEKLLEQLEEITG